MLSSIVIKPMSNALSCNADNSRPFLGFTLLSLSIRHGTMWLATSSLGIDNPVIQHCPLYALKTAARKKSWPMRTVVCAARSSPAGKPLSSPWTSPPSGSTIASKSLVARSDSTAKRSQLSCISAHIARSLVDAFFRPLRPVSVTSGSRLAILTSFIASADGVRSMAFAIRTISGFLACSLPNGIRQCNANATSSCWRVQPDLLVSCIRSSVVNKWVLYANPFLRFEQESGFLSFWKPSNNVVNYGYRTLVATVLIVKRN